MTRTVLLKDGREATIRSARPADAEALIAHVNTIGAEGSYILTEKLDKTVGQEREWIESYDGERGLLLVAELDKLLVGSMDITRPPQEKARHLAGIGIAIQARGRGVGLGRALMQGGIDWAWSKGVMGVTLHVYGTNQRAIALYQKLGFVEDARLKGHVILHGVPDDVVVMTKWRAPADPART